MNTYWRIHSLSKSDDTADTPPPLRITENRVNPVEVPNGRPYTTSISQDDGNTSTCRISTETNPIEGFL